MSSVGHILTIISFFFFFLMFSESFLNKNSKKNIFFGISRLNKRVLYYKLKINLTKKKKKINLVIPQEIYYKC